VKPTSSLNSIYGLQRLLLDQNKRVYLVFSLIWLLSCQLGFFFLQKNLGNKTLNSIQNQLRQELDFSNFQYLARSITDYQNSGSIRCALVKMKAPAEMEILDLRYMTDPQSCVDSEWLLSGAHITRDLQSLNGDMYSFDFVNDNGNIFYLALWSFRVFGLVLIAMAYRNMLLRLKTQSARLEAEIAYANELTSLSRRLAHDIRSPLSALNMLASEAAGLETERREIIASVVAKINGIANDLLYKKQTLSNELKVSTTPQLEFVNSNCEILPEIEMLVKEKSIEFQNNPLVKIILQPSSCHKGIRGAISPKEISRILSNLINNSVEAIVDDGSIYLEVSERNAMISIAITDFGRGIPEHILEDLRKGPISYGKTGETSGSGIGIFSADEVLSANGGNIQITSKLGVGTKVIISIPSAL
jgi:signal transduction histidine kinase